MGRLYRFAERPGEVPPAILRPFMGGADAPFNIRPRDFVLGVTKPGPTNTGVLPGSALTTVSGDITVTTPNTTLENLDIHGRIFARALNLTIRNCRIRGLGTPAGANLVECLRSDTSTLLVDCTLAPDTPALSWGNGVFGGDWTALRCDVGHVVDGFGALSMTGDPAGPTGVKLLGCYFHDFAYFSPDPAHQGQPGAGNDNATHNDGIQIHGGSGTIVRGCYFDMTESPYSAVSTGGHPSGGLYGAGITLTPNQGPVTATLIESNWLDHGSSGVHGIGPYPIAATIRNNRFGPNIAATDLNGTGLARRAITFPADPAIADVLDFPASTGPDLLAGNVDEATGQPTTIWRQNP